MISPFSRRARIGAPNPKRWMLSATLRTGSPSFFRGLSFHGRSALIATHSAAGSLVGTGRRSAALIQRPWNVHGRSHWGPDVIGRVPEQERMSTHAEAEDRGAERRRRLRPRVHRRAED